LARALRQRARHIIKSFLVLFFKKERLALSLPVLFEQEILTKEFLA
jgi:hypothetical protein